ncbi:protein of unknown function [Cellulosimicrobium cellulans]|nr:protein of unknown function [Cellulosimicrobium cellulans]
MHLLDANVLIEAARTYYPLDIARGYWEWVEASHARGMVASVAAVREEIIHGDDALAEWARTVPTSFWIPESDETVAAIGVLATWVERPDSPFTRAARNEFLDSADLLLIAEGMAHRHVVVTRELSHPESKKRVLIPDACLPHGVRWENPFDVYRALGLRLERPSP